MKAPKFVQMNADRKVQLVELPDRSQMIFNASEATVYFINKSNREVSLVYLSRTPWPALVLYLTVWEVLYRYLEGGGWCVYHAGAVGTPDGIVAVIGGGGSGKTTLVAGLVRAGVAFVANERCFFRAADDWIEALTFIQPVHICIGTAWQFPVHGQLVTDQARLALPQVRFNRRRVDGTARHEQWKLPDKLSLLPCEFSAAINGSQPVISGHILGIVHPRLDLEAKEASCSNLDKENLTQLVANNTLIRGQDQHYPNWLGLDFPAAPVQAKALSTLPATEFTYCVDSEEFCGSGNPIELILDALASAGKDAKRVQ